MKLEYIKNIRAKVTPIYRVKVKLNRYKIFFHFTFPMEKKASHVQERKGLSKS